MKFLPALVAILLFGCAHAPLPQARPGEQSWMFEGGTRILLRYAPEDGEVASRVRRVLEVALPVATRWGALPPRVTITVHPTHEALEAAARRPDRPWLRAWARADRIELQSPRSWSRGTATDTELAQLLVHELTHCALHRAVGNDGGRARTIPLWFWEGMATTNAGERFTTVHASSAGPRVARAALHDADAPLVYPTADHAFRSLVQRHGETRIRQLLARLRDGVEFPDAFQEVMGVRLELFERELEGEARQERTHG